MFLCIHLSCCFLGDGHPQTGGRGGQHLVLAFAPSQKANLILAHLRPPRFLAVVAEGSASADQKTNAFRASCLPANHSQDEASRGISARYSNKYDAFTACCFSTNHLSQLPKR